MSATTLPSILRMPASAMAFAHFERKAVVVFGTEPLPRPLPNSKPKEGSHDPLIYRFPFSTPFSIGAEVSKVVTKRKSAPSNSNAAPVVSSFITDAGGTTFSSR